MKSVGFFSAVSRMGGCISIPHVERSQSNFSTLPFRTLISVFYGLFVAVPSILYLMGADALAKRFAFPWNVLCLPALVAVGFGLGYLVMLHLYGNAVFASRESTFFMLQLAAPNLLISVIVVVRRAFAANAAEPSSQAPAQ